MSNFIKIYVILFLIEIVYLQTHKKFELNKVYKGTLKSDDSYEYYKLEIPPGLENNTKSLVFVMKEDKSEVKKGNEIFSDPDIIISKVKEYPKLFDKSGWQSEQYGNDIISISSNHVKSGEVFYIAMYCQFPCRYIVSSYLAESTELEIGSTYSVKIQKGTSMNYYFDIPDIDYNELNIVANSAFLNEFKIFVEKDSPSSVHTYPINPSWTGGYICSISKDNPDKYCKNCRLQVLLEGNDKYDSIIQLYAFFREKEMKIIPSSPIYDFSKRRNLNCYAFNIDKSHFENNEEIILNLILFSGSDIFYVSGYNSINKEEIIEEIKKSDNNDYKYNVKNSMTLHLKKEDLKKFEKNAKDIKPTEDYERQLHFCVYSEQTSSYTLTAYYLSEVEVTQKHNFLFPNNEIYGYMQKDQTTSYKIIDYSQKQDIKISIFKSEGKIDVYLFYCYNTNCYFTKNEIEKRLKNDELILPENPSSDRYDLSIPINKNKCALLNLPENEKSLCNPLVIVHCKDSEICEFRILAQFSKNPILMQPSTSYYGIISPNSNDLYDIIIDDDSVISLVVVLSSASGDAQVLAYKYMDSNTKQLVGISYNDAYVADILRITKKHTGNKNLIGRYQINIFTKLFSSYNLYYYLTYPRDIKPKESDITSIINTGEMIKDIFPLKQDYKIYSFKPTKKEDIKINIKNQNLIFSFRVYLDLNKIKYDDSIQFDRNRPDKWMGYEWRSGYNDELIISSSDPKFVINSNYYIVVVKNFTSNNYTSDDVSATFYLSVSTVFKSLQLNEGIEHTAALKNEYKMQKYYYTHYNYMNNPFELNIEIFSGMVNVYINVTDIDTTKLLDSQSFIRKSLYMSLPFCMRINPSELIGKCKSSLRCELSILIEKASEREARYLIVAKSSEKSLEMLTSGIAKTGKLSNNVFRYYYVEEMTKRKSTTINVNFKEGSGELYVRIPKIAEKRGDIILPNNTFYDYKGTPNYRGAMVQIPSEVYDRISETNPKIQIIIGIRGSSYLNESTGIEFVISYSSDIMKISQNYPKNSFINMNEVHYYELYFEKGTKNIYISLSNMNGGDADIFMNYGIQQLPTDEKYDWISNNAGHEFLSINKEDEYFKKNNINDIGGYYSLMILGYSNTSYTLFVSSGDILIFPLIEGCPITCRCQKEGDKCYFNYNNFDSYFTYKNDSDSIDILITTYYYYGRGLLYSKLVKGNEFYSKGDNAISLFPTKSQTQENYFNHFLAYVNINKNDTQFDANSLLLLTLECQTASAIDVYASENDKNGDSFYIDAEKQNTFLFTKKNPKYLYFYNFQSKSLLYQMRALFGKANVIVYVNETKYDEITHKEINNYIHLSTFILHAKRRGRNNEHDDNEGVRVYQNSITNSQLVDKKTIIFKITPLSEKFAFFTKINFNYKWMELTMNNPNSLMMQKEGFKGYFDVNDDYSQVELNLALDEKVGKIGVIFVKVNYLHQHRHRNATNEDDAYRYSVPTYKNYDYRAVTDKVLGTASIILKDFKKESSLYHANKIRVLIAVNIRKYSQNETDEYENEFDVDYEHQMSTNTKFQITLNPKIKGEQYLSFSEQQNYYYTSDLYKKNENTVKTFNLMTNSEEDNIMVIEISSCQGEYRYTINEVVQNVPTSTKIKYSVYKNGGREVITLTNLKSRNYQIKIYPVNNKPSCLIDNPSPSCDNIEVNYLLYYYSTNTYHYKYSLTNATFKYEPYKRGGIKIILPKLKEEDAMGNQRQINDIKFDVFISENPEDFEKMNSVCFLSRSSKLSNLKLYKNIKNKQGNIYISGLKSGAPFYVNVLAENTKTKEMINFTPMLVYSGSFMNSLPVWLIILGILLIIGLILSVLFYYFKYKKTKIILNYERNDIQNMATIPRSEAELSDMSKRENEVHYSNLTLDSQKI